MTRKRRRMLAVLAGLAMLGIATGLVLSAFNSSGALAFFTSPSEIEARGSPAGRALRLGGLVEKGSVERKPDGKTVAFRVTDGRAAVPVIYQGALPDLFREGQGVVATGVLGRDGVFRAASVLAKHDERYMPREVVEALKKSGHWQEGDPGR